MMGPEEKKARISNLRSFVRKNTRIHTICTRSKSGMSGTVRVFVISRGEIREITHIVAMACGLRLTKDDSIRINGCGFDRGHAVVQDIGATLWPPTGAYVNLLHVRL